MPEPTVPVPVTELQALHQLLVEAAAQLSAAQVELKRLEEEEFVNVRFRVALATPGATRASALVVQAWLRKSPPETTLRSTP